MSKTLDKRIILEESMLKELSRKIHNVFGSYNKAAKALGISYTEFWRFCNGKRKSIPKFMFTKICNILKLNKDELSFDVLEPIESKFIIDIPLDMCLFKKKDEFFLDMRTLLINSGYLNKLRELKGIIKNFDYKIRENQLIVDFEVYDKGIKNFKRQIGKLPCLLQLNKDLLYFLGLRFGDGTSETRVGIVNKNLNLLKWTSNFLKNFSETENIEALIMIYDKSELQNIQTHKTNLQNIGIFNHKIIENYGAHGKYSYAVYVNNNFLSKALDYLIKIIKKFWNSLPMQLKGSFLAGIFDAEGNVNKWDENIRISQLTPNKIRLIDFIFKQERYNFRYDGCNFVLGNLKETRAQNFKKFEKQVLPYMKHSEKIKEIKELLSGNLVKESFKDTLKLISQKPGITQKELKTILNKRCDRELRNLTKQNYLRIADYPRKYFITVKGLEWINTKRGEGQ